MATRSGYRPTEAKYKGGAAEMYVTYDLEQRTRNGTTAMYPKARRVYIAGDVKDWELGDFQKRSGRTAHGVRVAYEQSRRGYRRRGYTARRDGTEYRVRPTEVPETRQRFEQIVDVPADAKNVKFRKGALPKRYQAALQDVR